MIKINQWRITKYNPAFRDENGWYINRSSLLDDWNSYYDICETHPDEYIRIENLYIKAIISILRSNKEEFLCIESLEKKYYRKFIKNSGLHSRNTRRFVKNITVGSLLNEEEIRLIAKLILREVIWAKLENGSMYAHFDYNYYMYIGSIATPKENFKEIKKNGLFVEKFKSTYLDLD